MIASLAAACDDGPPAPPDEPPRPHAHGAPGEPAGDGVGEEEPPPPSLFGDEVPPIEESLARHETTEACIERLRTGTPIEVSELAADLGYDQMLVDSCNAVRAVRDGDVAACDALAVSAIQRGCRRRLAAVHGEPDACPDDPVVGGREPLCLAWAQRNPTLCRGVGPGDRALCTTVLARDRHACARLSAALRPRCEVAIERLGSVLDGDAVGPEDLGTPRFHLEARLEASGAAAGGAAARGPIEIDRDVLERGVNLSGHGCAWTIAFQDPNGEHPSPISFAERPPTATVTVDVPIGAELPLAVPIGAGAAGVQLVLPGIGSADGVSGATGTVTVTRFEPERGGRVEAHVDGSLALSPGRVRVAGDLATYVRDVDALEERCTVE